MIPTTEHAITWPRVLSPPFATMRDRLGKVNNAVLTFVTGSISVETLLFLGAELHRDIMSDGQLGWEVTYRFSEKHNDEETDPSGICDAPDVAGWNHVYRDESDKQGFYRVRRKDGTGGIYATASFSELFVEV